MSQEGPPPLWPCRGGRRLNYISAPPAAEFIRRDRRSVALLGSTGSIGCNALDVIANNQDFLQVRALACGANIELLARQASFYKPPYLAVQDARGVQKLRRLLPSGYLPEIWHGKQGYAALASLREVDIVLSAQSGSAGLPATLGAAIAGKAIALANKESLVLAGDLLRQICGRTGAAIFPVDSEHYALFQCLAGRGDSAIKLILTASGGPFRTFKPEQLRSVSPDAALRHPNWKMGRKISIDSATLMNKGFEMIEAAALYGAPADMIDVLIHPQSVVHSLVEFADNSLLAQLGAADMRMPISACMLWPRCAPDQVAALDLVSCGPLAFEYPDWETFKCLRLAREALNYVPTPSWRRLGLNPARIILACANDAAVSLFLGRKIGFCEIGDMVESAMSAILPEIGAPEEDGAGDFNELAAKALDEIAALESRIAAMFSCEDKH